MAVLRTFSKGFFGRTNVQVESERRKKRAEGWNGVLGGVEGLEMCLAFVFLYALQHPKGWHSLVSPCIPQSVVIFVLRLVVPELNRQISHAFTHVHVLNFCSLVWVRRKTDYVGYLFIYMDSVNWKISISLVT